jgi:alpha-1,2-mannosyltransferase
VRTVLALVATAAIAAAIAFETTQLNLFSRADRPMMMAVLAAAWLFFALAFLALRKVPAKHVTVVVVSGAVLIGGAAMLAPPNTSTDSARYAWDGIVATAGISPYDHVPASDALEKLRPEWLFPADCDATRISETTTVPSGEPLCTAINRPHVPTIYPPLAELYFTGVRALVDPSVEYWPFQLGGLVISLGVTWMLLVALRRRGMDPRWAALWAWCPLVATEAVTNSHVDVLGVALALAASLLVASGHRVWGGIAMGAAIATKLIPVILAPPLLKKRPLTLITVSIVTFALLYVPYVVMSGFGVLGYLPGYLSEEGYDDGSRFALLSIVLPGSAAVIVAAALIAVATGLAWWKSDASAPWLAQLALVGSILIIVSPRYPWYALLMIPFIVLSQRWEWFVVPLVLTLRMVTPTVAMTRTALAVCVVVLVAAWLYRRRRTRPISSTTLQEVRA